MSEYVRGVRTCCDVVFAFLVLSPVTVQCDTCAGYTRTLIHPGLVIIVSAQCDTTRGSERATMPSYNRINT